MDVMICVCAVPIHIYYYTKEILHIVYAHNIILHIRLHYIHTIGNDFYDKQVCEWNPGNQKNSIPLNASFLEPNSTYLDNSNNENTVLN